MSTKASKTRLPPSLTCVGSSRSLEEMGEILEHDQDALERKLSSTWSLRRQLHSTGTKLLEATFEENDLLTSLSNLKDQLTSIKIRNEQHRQNYQVAKKKHSALQAKSTDLTRNIDSIKAQSRVLSKSIPALEADIEEKRNTLVDQRTAHSILEDEIDKWNAKLDKARQERESLEASVRVARKETMDEVKKLRAVKEEINDLVRKLSLLQTSVASLAAVRQEVASTQSSVKALAEERDTWATPVMALSSTAKPKPDFTCLHDIIDPSSPSPPLTPPSRRRFRQRSSNRYSLVDLHGTRARSKVLPVSPLQGAPLETPSFMSLPGSPDS